MVNSLRVVIDVEANSLNNPTQVWVIVCKDIDTGEFHIFREVTSDALEKERFQKFCEKVTLWIGHNLIEYDGPVLANLLGVRLPDRFGDDGGGVLDTLIISRLVDFSRRHSIEAYGLEFGLPKGIPIDDELLPSKYFPIHIFLKYSKDLEDYCVRDVEICHKIYNKLRGYIDNHSNRAAICLEQQFQLVVNSLHTNGFFFNSTRARSLLERVEQRLKELDDAILREFPPKEVLIREFTPRVTKHGTVARNSVPRELLIHIHNYQVGETYRYTRLEDFNPASHKQIIQVLNEAGWQPVDKTKSHIETERELSRLDRSRERSQTFDIERKECYDALLKLRKVGWKVNENNLNTLPKSAPAPARTLAQRILYESRRRTLKEWIDLVKEDGRIHGRFQGIGAWTHRMSHQKPNTANIPNELDTAGNKKLLGKEMRSLWCAPRNRLLVGVDAEGIQLRIFAHYIDDPEFTKALVEGKKDDKTDPHSLNQRILGSVCKSRAAAKRFIYALLLGAGIGKLTEILGCSDAEAKRALDRLLERYTGFQYLKERIIPKDAARGYFIGLDGRQVRLPGDQTSERRHLAMSGYLQNGEAIVMKRATLKWHDLLKQENAILVNFVHDEWQTEVPNDMAVAIRIAQMQADSLRKVGEELKLKCPLAGSYYNDDIKDYTIATNWAHTH